MLAVLAPGQGAQTPAFLTPWLALSDVAAALEWSSAVAGRDLVALGVTGAEDELRDTAACQPLLVAAGLAVGRHLLADTEAEAAWYAGHSVGELTAAALAGALTDEAALVFARARGDAMAAAAARTPAGMAAVVGGAPEAIEHAATAHGLAVANHNGAGQVVVAGALDALDAFAGAATARVVRLRVAGAFHTGFMAPARDALAALPVPVADPRAHLVSNADGAVVRAGAELRDRLVAQVAAPVRWDRCVETLVAAGVRAAIELPPAGTLTALLKRAHRDVEVVALRTPDDLPAARRLLAEHLSGAEPPAPAWRVVVAPVAGEFRAEPVGAVAAAQRVGVVSGRRGATDVVAPYAGHLVEWLARDGDPVQPGQPLAVLHPDAP